MILANAFFAKGDKIWNDSEVGLYIFFWLSSVFFTIRGFCEDGLLLSILFSKQFGQRPFKEYGKDFVLGFSKVPKRYSVLGNFKKGQKKGGFFLTFFCAIRKMVFFFFSTRMEMEEVKIGYIRLMERINHVFSSRISFSAFLIFFVGPEFLFKKKESRIFAFVLLVKFCIIKVSNFGRSFCFSRGVKENLEKWWFPLDLWKRISSNPERKRTPLQNRMQKKKFLTLTKNWLIKGNFFTFRSNDGPYWENLFLANAVLSWREFEKELFLKKKKLINVFLKIG